MLRPVGLALRATLSQRERVDLVRRLNVHGARTLVQLDVRTPGIMNERERTARLGILRVRPIELNAGGFEFLAERFEVLHIEADMVEHASFGRDGSTVC